MSPEGHDPSASSSIDGPDPMLGQVLDGRYRVLVKLGEGGMGEVYAAEHVHIEKRVAIKLLRPEIVTNKEAVSRFRQEARSASSIGHKNIIAIEDFGTIADGRIYLCMELLQGQPFNDMIKEALSLDRLLNILIQTGHGLSAAHAKDIIHRDMKPENIFVTNGDVPKLLDFGIAKVSGADGQNHLTRTGTIFGTPFYMAPEQALGQAVDHRADIYAMGVIMYEVFTGSIPFTGESFMGILTQHITAEPKPVQTMAAEHGRQVPPGLEEIIVKAMKKDPEERYPTMDELVSALIAVYRSAVGSGMSAYMDAHIPGSAVMPTAADPSGMVQRAPSASMQAAHTPLPAQASGQGSSSYANVPARQPTSPHYPGPAGYHSPASSVYELPKKSKTGLIVGGLIIVALTAAAVLFYVFGVDKGIDEGDGKAGTASTGDDVAAVSPDASAAVSTKRDAAAVVTKPIDAGAPVAATKLDAAPAVVATKEDAGVVVTPPPGDKTIKVTIKSTPSGADVYLGRKRIGKTPHVVKVKKGARAKSYKVSERGYRSSTVRVSGKNDTVSVALRKKPTTGGGTGGTGGSAGSNTGGSGSGTASDKPPDPCKASKTSLACLCKKPRSKGCVCKKNPDDPICWLE